MNDSDTPNDPSSARGGVAPTTSAGDRGPLNDPSPADDEAPRRDWLSIAAITSMALAIALTVTWVVFGIVSDDSDAVDVRDAIDETGSGDREPSAPGDLEVGAPAPDVALEYLGGGTGSFSDLAGTPVVVNFWSSTCAPCLAEMPDLESAHQELGDDVAFLGVDVTDTEQAGAEMVEQTGVTYPNARDPRGEVMTTFGGTALPRTVLVDAEGTVVDAHTGALTREELFDKLDAAGLTGS